MVCVYTLQAGDYSDSAALLSFFALVLRWVDPSVLPSLHSRTQAFYDHWRDLPRHDDRLVPLCGDFLDRAPVKFMPSVFIHEVVDGRLLVRFMGTELVDRWRRDDTGHEFGARLSPEERARLARVAAIITSHPCGLLQRGVLGTSTGRVASFEGILLPLAVEDGAPARIVVFSTILDTLGREEHGSSLASAGERWWLDIGAGCPAIPPPAR